ncbi:glycosyl hydrolase catalytic core-domain-containing protein [Suillus subalutaceus]|uniref:glycosyl hydrolase catalytic core-domain-containing protein n=1 Tax=Suillus subalutaceus TaxID=48586 RepID=UPI001B86371F|nr:glycosyl hydrolase catalytic core-domain-containing protein [Suillus subalutaceus]KAG1869007.1 glycosyl hydrolase catalytic core-domain-containing protein [Suillus subalutaceus]
MLTSARLAVIALFVPIVLAGKRGLCWTYFDGTLDPGVFNNGDGEVVAILPTETVASDSSALQRCTDCSSSPIADLASRQAAQGWATVFTLNEPDINGITPSEAASWYIEYVNPLAIKKALPAVTSSVTSGEGLSWVSEMISACAGQCYFDYINLHWYGSTFAEFQSYVESANSQFPDYQLVITEFALENPAGGQADQVTFFQQAFPFLDGASYVQLYFPFIATSPALFTEYNPSGADLIGTGSCLYNDDGSPSAVGDLMY